MRIYAIGDIHGQRAMLEAAHERIARDGGDHALVVHVGDLIDRGPDSRGVIALLMDGQARGRNWLVVKGNHDRQLPNFLRDPRWIDPRAAEQKDWIARNSGADTTLASYGVNDAMLRDLDAVHAEALAAIPADHARWLDGLPIWHLTPWALFVHAGIRPGVALADQTPADLLGRPDLGRIQAGARADLEAVAGPPAATIGRIGEGVCRGVEPLGRVLGEDQFVGPRADERRDVGAVGHVELHAGTVDVPLHRADGDHEPLRDLFVRQPRRDQIRDLPLASGQR
mgnify:CR=1 FL=1